MFIDNKNYKKKKKAIRLRKPTLISWFYTSYTQSNRSLKGYIY